MQGPDFSAALENYSNTVVQDYQRKFLNLILLVSIGVLAIIMARDLYDWLFNPLQQWGLLNFISDLLMFSALGSAWELNRRGYNALAGWFFTLLIMLAIPLAYSQQSFSQAILIMSFPMVLSSFAIHPCASFLVAGFSLSVYTYEYISSNGVFYFDTFAIVSLVLIALISYLIANILNTTLRNLVSTYDETIQAWSLTLEMRDAETMGHSKRVVELTLRLAADMGIKRETLIHLRRGVLLHDFGKLLIPNAILTKPGPLTEEEWKIMRKHPEYAYQVFSKISYLAPALDIPYCHHERWDGSGYPRGLKGEAIPLPARIFAIVDVWDALTTTRYYREAWSHEKTMQYIQEQAGRYFDPRVVVAFAHLMAKPPVALGGQQEQAPAG
jgi:HD-GYP domain-containing protein (c-di-GMP phosphodiesterase class II)